MIADRFEVIRTLGQGTFGRTLLARDQLNDSVVAIKLLEGRSDWKARELFEREAQVLRGLRHQGIPQVFDTLRAEVDGSASSLLVMEYIEGVSLAEMIAARSPLDGTQVVQYFLELLSILEYLHGRVPPVLHRDIKPANIIVRPNGVPVLVDFGSVRHVHLGPEESGSTVVGTYGYMPYEQYMGQASPASDLYALGATLLHLVTGRAPREYMNEEGRIKVPSSLPGDPRLQPILARLLRPSPAERFANAREVKEAIIAPSAAVAEQRGPVARTALALGSLPPAPRMVEGVIAEAMERATPTGWDLMDASNKPSGSIGAMDVLSFAFFSLISIGVIPLVFFGMAASRRRRMKKFFRLGELAVAEVLSIRRESVAFGEHMCRVNYQFQADGDLRRDTDQIMPIIANRWHEGDRIQVLYIGEENYDSVIISAG